VGDSGPDATGARDAGLADQESGGQADVTLGTPDAGLDGLWGDDRARDGSPDVHDVAVDTSEEDGSPDEGPDERPDERPDEPRCDDLAPECGSGCANGGGTVRRSNFDIQESAVLLGSSLVSGFSFAWSEDTATKATYRTVFSADLTPDATDTYTFLLRSSNGSLLNIDGQLLIDHWNRADFKETLAVQKPLEAGHTYRVEVEHRDSQGNLSVRLDWQRPGGQAEPIPSCLLKEAQPAPTLCDPLVSSFDCVPLGTAPCGAGTGLVAEYYFLNYDNTKQLAHTDLHAALRPAWGFIEAPATSPRFEVRWNGFIQAPATGDYTFFVLAAEYVNLTIEGQSNGSDNNEGVYLPGTITVPLTAGKKTPISLEAPMSGPGAFIQIRWQGPSVPQGDIPTCRLFPPDPTDAGADGG
jgi:hypothetical protein